MKPFFIDKKENQLVTYDRFISDIIGGNTFFHPYLHTNNTYRIFLNMVIGLITNQDVVLLDSEFTEDEIAKMIGNYDKTYQKRPVNINIENFADLQRKIENASADIGLFTSGTTGLPKLITHNIEFFITAVRRGAKYQDHVWGLAYNPTHMAGLQVFFQALLNKNTLIKLFGMSNRDIIASLTEENISHLSATPTFYRLLNIKNPIETVKRITFGGEKSNNELYKRMEIAFPNAKINNIYATTEFGTLFISEGTDFKISKEREHLIKFENNLLYVDKSLVGKNLENVEIEGDWYCTKDKIEVVSENPFRFRFVSRVSNTINIGGYNVDLKEIEEALLKCEEVKLARVFAKNNRLLGNILRAEVVLENDKNIKEKELLDILAQKLQPHKVPRIIKFVENIELTRTGKIKQ